MYLHSYYTSKIFINHYRSFQCMRTMYFLALEDTYLILCLPVNLSKSLIPNLLLAHWSLMVCHCNYYRMFKNILKVLSVIQLSSLFSNFYKPFAPPSSCFTLVCALKIYVHTFSHFRKCTLYLTPFPYYENNKWSMYYTHTALTFLYIQDNGRITLNF